MSSISSVGGDTSQRWQALKESPANQTADGASASRTRPPRGPPPTASDPSTTGSVDASGNPTAANGISGASAKVISDLKALFIDLQSGGSGAGAANAATGTALTAAALGATSTAAAISTGTSGATSVQSDLKTLAGDLGKVGGHHGGHYSHRTPPADASSTDPTAEAATSATTTAGQPAQKPAGGILDQLVGALKAYAASSGDNAAKATTGLNA